MIHKVFVESLTLVKSDLHVQVYIFPYWACIINITKCPTQYSSICLQKILIKKYQLIQTPPEVIMLPRLSALLLPSLLLSSVLCLEEESCSKDGGKEDCGAKKENKFKYNNRHEKYIYVHSYINPSPFQEDCLGDGGLRICGPSRD